MASPGTLHRHMRLLRFAGPYKWRLLGLVLLTALLSVLAMLPPLVMRAFIDRVVEGGERDLFSTLGVCLVALPVTIAFCGFIQSNGLAIVGWRFLCDLRMFLYNHILSMSMRFFGKNSTGMLVTRLMNDTTNVGDMVGGQTLSVVSDLVCASFAITATFAINWRLACVLVAVLVLFAVNWQFNIGRMHRIGRSYWQSFDRLSGGIQNRLSANLAIKTFGAEDREQGAYRGQSDESQSLQYSANRTHNTFWMNTMLIQSLGRASIFFIGCAMVLRGAVSYGDVLAFTTYAMQLVWPAVRLSEIARQFQNFRVAVERIDEILEEQPEIRSRPGAARIGRLTGRVEFEHVHFHYEAGRPVIRDFTLQVKPGETIALVGPTGCGKTTILSLLLRFFDVGEGRLLLDGADIRDIDLKDLRRQYGIVLQEPMLFNVSILDNVRYARPGATRAEIEEACRIAEIHDFIMTLPKGYDSIIGTEGTLLSTGQKQRLTIARAVVADPAILIMDEATSSLDSESERAIQLAMQRALVNRTSFIVAHRLSTIRNADRIIVMKGGRIHEIGNHQELMAIPDGEYHNLYNRYMSKGVISDEQEH